jgi:splicing factor 45
MGVSVAIADVATRCLLALQNMVAPGEVDADLEGETAEECEKYGPVRQCLVFEVRLYDQAAGVVHYQPS